jgi:carbamoyltransferase
MQTISAIFWRLMKRDCSEMAELILSLHSGPHDSVAALFEDYDLTAAVQLERLTRIKGDGNKHPDLCIDEVLSIAGARRADVDVISMSRTLLDTKYFRRMNGIRWLRELALRKTRGRNLEYMTHEMRRYHSDKLEDLFDFASFRRDGRFRTDVKLHFSNHHQAHAMPALFYSPWDEALLVTADGGGDTVNYSHRVFRAGAIETIYGGDECLFLEKPVDSLGRAYSAATLALGFRMDRHEGKLTGLAALGKPVRAEEIGDYFSVDENGRVYSKFLGFSHMRSFMRQLAKTTSAEDLAASIQQVLEDTMLASVGSLLAKFPIKNLGLAGGVFANVRLNRLLAEKLGLDEVFIFPAMGDEGLPVGSALIYLMERDGLKVWLERRRPLGPIFLGRDYTRAIDPALEALPNIRRIDGPPTEGAVRRLVDGNIGAIFTGRMEYGPRALGARSILANPSRRDTHDLLNRRLARTEFMPFAPVVAAERAADVFEIGAANARACQYMTIACGVRPQWRERIPAVVHVDQSARPQTIRREDNPLYYDIVRGVEAASGLPVLVNTSFNVHEEPIVNAPAECARALVDGRIDFVVTERGVYENSGRS